MGMMINRRRGYGGKSLPYDAQVEYLKSSGTQYIDIGEFFNGLTTKIYLKYKGETNKNFAIGCLSANNANSFVFANGGSNGMNYVFYFFRYYNIYAQPSMGSTQDNIKEAELTNVFKVDGNTLCTFTSNDFTTQSTLFLFACKRTDGTPSSLSTMRVYSCQIYQNDVLVKDFIPVRIGQVGYMYDKVSGQLFGNDGTGGFILGPDV